MAAPKVFLSYSWDDDAHRLWVAALATRLRADGIHAVLDQWSLAPGDQLPAFMEAAVRDSDYVIVICTPTYKAKSDGRTGGAGYEGDIMAAEVLTGTTRRKFIPVLRIKPLVTSAPSWLLGSYYIDLAGDPYPAAEYAKLVATLHGMVMAAPPIGGHSPALGAAAPIASDPLLPPGTLAILESKYLVPRRESKDQHRQRLRLLEQRKGQLTQSDVDHWEMHWVEQREPEVYVAAWTATEVELKVLGRPLNVRRELVRPAWRRADGRIGMYLDQAIEVPNDPAGWLRLV